MAPTKHCERRSSATLTGRGHGSSEGALLRVSTVSRDAAQFDLNMEFLAAFAVDLGADARAVLLGEESV